MVSSSIKLKNEKQQEKQQKNHTIEYYNTVENNSPTRYKY